MNRPNGRRSGARAAAIAYGVAAVADLVLTAIGPAGAAGRWVSKPALMATLGGYLALARTRNVKRFAAAGIGLSLVGDVALMFRSDTAFAAGLGSFLAAHLSYCAGFVRRGGLTGLRDNGLRAVPAIVLVTAGAVTILPHAGALAVPVAVYMAVIGAMAALAAGTGDRRSTAGALLFCVSDFSLAVGKFVPNPVPAAALGTAVMATYAAGQWLIVSGLTDPVWTATSEQLHHHDR